MRLSVLSQSANERGLAFLLIGGHAVMAHGHPRIRHGHAGRMEKDVEDVIELVRINRVNLAEPEWRELAR